jgi:hypothetical protein
MISSAALVDTPKASANNLSPDNIIAPVAADTAGRNRLVINLLLVATFVVILNETFMAVASHGSCATSMSRQVDSVILVFP